MATNLVPALIAKYGGRAPRYTSYPTAAQFTAQVSQNDYRAWLAEVDRRSPLSLYVHIPFCDRLCWYCGCHTTVVHRRGPIAHYVRTLIREIELASEALPADMRAKALHIGGGTPNMLAASELRAIVGALGRHFQFTSPFAFAAELDPRTLTREWIDAAAEMGMNRASVGVQDLNPKVQRAINRFQPYAQVEWAVRQLRQARIGSINLDLMYGLPHQTTDNLLSTLDQVLVLSPDRIALFGYAHVPWMKPHQKLIAEAHLPDAIARFGQQQAAAERLDRAGYARIGLDHFAKPDDELAQAAREGRLRRNFQGYTVDGAASLLGFGASAISALPQGYAQNAVHVPEWSRCIEQDRLPTSRGVFIGPEDRLRSAIIERLMCDMEVDVSRICAAHDGALSSVAPELFRLREMEADGLVKRRGMRIGITDRGRPFVRAIAGVFDEYLHGGEARGSSSAV